MNDINILLVDDKSENLLALKSVLEEPNLNIITSRSGNEALALMLEHDFALVLLDVQMPDMDGFETARLMRGNKKTKHIPIIFITAINKDESHVFKGYASGAVDYLFKPFNPYILKSKVNVFLQLHGQKVTLEETSRQLVHTLEEFRKANHKLLEQQRSVIEEERLKILLQMAGATAHELNQPLMTLLGHIDLMYLYKDNPEKLSMQMQKVKQTGLRISDIVSKIQNIREYRTKPYLKNLAIINLDQKINILLIIDSDHDYKTVDGILSNYSQFNVYRAKTISQALTMLESRTEIHLILIEFHLSDGNSMDFLQQMKTSSQDDIPLIVITPEGDEMTVSRMIQAGFYNYIQRDNISEDTLSHVIANSMEKSSIRKEIHQIMKQVGEISIRDTMTGLYNRQYFKEVIDREISRAIRYGTRLTLCMIDVDDFKHITSTYGQPAGDMLLGEIGILLARCFRKSDLLCRYGEDIISIIIPNTGIQEAGIVCNRFREAVARHPFKLLSENITITVSCGIASLNLKPSPGEKPADELINSAYTSMLEAKQSKKNIEVTYQPDEAVSEK